jgi:hypothetical protein
MPSAINDDPEIHGHGGAVSTNKNFKQSRRDGSRSGNRKERQTDSTRNNS